MLTPEIIFNKANNKWNEYKKVLITHIILGSDFLFFPLIIRGNTSLDKSFNNNASSYSILYNNSKEKVGKGYLIEWEDKKIRGLGNQSEIKKIVIPSNDDYLFITQKEKQYKAIVKALNILNPLFEKYSTKEVFLSWALSKSNEIEDNTISWEGIYKVLSWFLENKNSNMYYLRELPIEVHTKFIENNSNILISLYGYLLNKDFKGLRLEEVFNIKRKPILIRLKLKHKLFEEIALPLSSLKKLDNAYDLSQIERIFIIENEAVYLSFPIKDKDLCIFGGGFQVKILDIPWFKEKNIYYFGDLDEHGLEILSIARSLYPSLKSIMMDIETYENFYCYSVGGPKATCFDNLDRNELELLQKLRQNEPSNNRIEQEKIDQEYILKYLEKLQS
ncbi:MAG: DUF2220 family protein [Spirochaetales bacterium]|nr:DUF2220 family protein [Spirochaetales bacterium]